MGLKTCRVQYRVSDIKGGFQKYISSSLFCLFLTLISVYSVFDGLHPAVRKRHEVGPLGEVSIPVLLLAVVEVAGIVQDQPLEGVPRGGERRDAVVVLGEGEEGEEEEEQYGAGLLHMGKVNGDWRWCVWGDSGESGLTDDGVIFDEIVSLWLRGRDWASVGGNEGHL